MTRYRPEIQQWLNTPQEPVPNPDYKPGPDWSGVVGVITCAIIFGPLVALLMATGFSWLTFTIGGGWIAFWVLLVAARLGRRQ